MPKRPSLIQANKEFKAKKIIEAIRATHGMLTLAAKMAGVSIPTVYKYAELPSVARAVKEARESMLDFAESKLFQGIAEGDKTCILFYLKTQGKARGYIERSEVTGLNGGAVNVKLETDDQFVGRINRLVIAIAEGGAPVQALPPGQGEGAIHVDNMGTAESTPPVG